MNKFTIIKEKAFYKSILTIMLPVAVQQTINMGVNMMDTIMLGSFGEVQLSASSLANSFYNIFTILCMGTIGGCSILAAQYWGAKNLQKVKETFSLAVRIAGSLALIFAVITWMFPQQIMRMFTTDNAVIEAGTAYLKITAVVYFFHGSSLVVTHLMRAVKQPRLGLYVSMLSFVVNIIANYIFIFGKFDMPRMEIAGAAVGTLIARMVEFIVTFIYVLKIDQKLGLRLQNLLWNPTREIVQKYIHVGMPVLASDGLLALGNTAVSIVIGRLGTDAVAANSICQVVDRLFTVVIAGISNASSVIIGNTIGEGDMKKVYVQGQTFYLFSVLCGVLNGLLVFFVGPFTLSFYTLAPGTILLTKQMMVAYAVIVVFQSVQSVMTKGVLRGGGDTKFLLVADILFLWIVSIPLGIISGIVLQWPAWLTMLFLKTDYAIKAAWCMGRLMSGKWIRRITVEK